MTIHAIYENGVFRPTEPVDIAEKTPVEVVVPPSESDKERVHRKAILEIMQRSYDTGQTDAAARHNEHQP